MLEAHERAMMHARAAANMKRCELFMGAACEVQDVSVQSAEVKILRGGESG